MGTFRLIYMAQKFSEENIFMKCFHQINCMMKYVGNNQLILIRLIVVKIYFILKTHLQFFIFQIYSLSCKSIKYFC